MSRSLKNRKIGNIVSTQDLRDTRPSKYEWVDGGDGFLYGTLVYDDSPRGQWHARHQYQRERLGYGVVAQTDKVMARLDTKRNRARVRAKIHDFLVGRIDDVIHDDIPNRQPWTW